VGILDAVENQQQQVPTVLQSLFDHCAQPSLIQDRTAPDLGHHALVARFTANLGQACPIRGLYLDPVLTSRLDNGLNTRVCSLVFSVDASDICRFGSQELLDCPQARDVLGLAHFFWLIFRGSSAPLFHRPKIDAPGFHVDAVHDHAHRVSEPKRLPGSFSDQALRARIVLIIVV
jgi:hypothetical protein